MLMKFKNIEIFKTQDGSIGLYNKELDEIYHSKFGAKKEAFEKFIEPCFVLDLNKPLMILDICYGIGYNTKTALEYFPFISRIDCLETNEELVFNSYKFEFSKKINSIIEKNIKKPEFIYFYIGDARNTIKKLQNKYDIIFHDGFAPHKQSVLWSEDFIKKIVSLMKKDSIYCTYNHSKPVLKALLDTGICIGKTVKDNRIAGTIASYNPDLIVNKLDEFELEQLNTKSAITYKDRNLNLSNEEIIKNRNLEVLNSSLLSLSKLKRIKQLQD